MTTTLFIGLDGATYTVLDALTRELPGEGLTMPFLKKLMAEGVRAKLIEIGGAAGLSDQQVTECINDQAGAERIRRLVEAGRSDGVTGTPTFVINGTRYEGAPDYENLARALDAAGA